MSYNSFLSQRITVLTCLVVVFIPEKRAFLDGHELGVQLDHVHLLVLIPPKISVSKFMGIVEGRTAIRVLNKFRKLRQQPYWGNRFWARGYCVDTVGLHTEMIRKYVKYQDDREK